MILRHGRRLAFGLPAAALLIGLAGGCTKVPDHQGFVLEQTLVSAIQPGTDNKDSVLNSLGRASFTGGFGDSDWYYVSRDTRNMAYDMPRVHDQTILHIHFDQAGNVATVEHKGMEQVASIRPNGDKTPTLGHRRSLFDELFGNIGAVGSAGAAGAPTTDNPH
jgi:outer membrane protein assembly factor BamE (lipoprotein component of BamABCDE complex)